MKSASYSVSSFCQCHYSGCACRSLHAHHQGGWMKPRVPTTATHPTNRPTIEVRSHTTQRGLRFIARMQPRNRWKSSSEVRRKIFGIFF